MVVKPLKLPADAEINPDAAPLDVERSPKKPPRFLGRDGVAPEPARQGEDRRDRRIDAGIDAEVDATRRIDGDVHADSYQGAVEGVSFEHVECAGARSGR